jgi:6-phosphofructokinase
VPANIDHGLPATHATVGFDAALNVVVSSCDRITDTTQAMNRVSIVDTMGGGVGALTLMGALAAGAECAIVAEDYGKSPDPLVEATGSLRTLQKHLSDFERKFATVLLQHRQFQQLDIARLHGRADMLFPEQEVRRTELGHTQRGGNPSYYDRLLGTIMGVEAVETIMNQKKLKKPTGKLLRQKGAKVEAVDLKWALSNRDGGYPWSDATRMENAKPLWRYKEIARLFNQISIYACPKKPRKPRPRSTSKAKKKAKKKTKKK